MGILKDLYCIHFIDFDVAREDKDKMSYISNVTITNVRLNNLVEHVYEKLDPRNNLRDPVVKTTFDALPEAVRRNLATSMFIYRYCIHRILTHYKLYTKEVWKSCITDDYYSQEVLSIVLKNEIAVRLDHHLNRMILLSDSKKIEMMLEIEYGKVLPTVQDKEWKITNLNDIDDLYFSNRSHYDKCMENDLSYLKDYKLPRALCIKTQRKTGQYRVIDGYHRLCSAIKEKKAFLVIYCEQ